MSRGTDSKGAGGGRALKYSLGTPVVQVFRPCWNVSVRCTAIYRRLCLGQKLECIFSQHHESVKKRKNGMTSRTESRCHAFGSRIFFRFIAFTAHATSA